MWKIASTRPQHALLAIGGCVCLWLVVSRDERSFFLLRNTLILCVSVCLIAMPAGTMTAWLLTKTDVPGRNLAWTAIVAMLFMPVYLQAAGWDAGLGRQGWLTNWNTGTLSLSLSGWIAAIWIHAVAAIPWVVLIVSRGLALVESELEEVALLDTGAAQVAMRVSLVRALPTVVIAGFVVCVLTSGEIAVTDLFQIRTYAEEIYTAGQAGGLGVWESGTENGAMVNGTVALFALVMGGAWAASRLRPHRRETSWSGSRVFRLQRLRWVGAAALAGCCATLLIVPLGHLIFQVGVAVERAGGGWTRSWSPQKAAAVLFRSMVEFRAEFFWSVILGVLAATTAVAAALMIARVARSFRPLSPLVFVIVAAGFAIPGPAVGLGVVWLLNQGQSSLLAWLYENTILAPYLTQTLRSLPVALWMSWYAMETIPPDILDAARLDGAGPLRSFVSIELPMRFSAIVASWLAAATLCIGDLAATNVASPPGLYTVPVRVFGLMHAGVDDVAAALCLIVGGVTYATALLTFALWCSDLEVAQK